jgi:uncharacterized membrane protein YeaQ/YmgE (transglycosylase-associated protein family)
MEKILIDLAIGAIGGNAAAAAKPNQSLGTVGNTIAGLLGGGIGSTLLEQVVGMSSMGMAGDIAGAGASGAVMIFLVNLAKKYLLK